MAEYRLVWYEGRNTPAAIMPGQKRKKKKGEGKVVKQRMATAAERKILDRNEWLRVDKDGKTPSDPGYGTGSKVRPQFNDNYNKASKVYSNKRKDSSEKNPMSKYKKKGKK